MSSADYRHMARALSLARRGLYSTDPNPRVGCVLVREGEIVGELDPKEITVQELGLYMAGSKMRDVV